MDDEHEANDGGREILPLKGQVLRAEEEAPDPDAGPWVEGEDRVSAALIGQLEGLRSRVRLLRTERASAAGRKQALEGVIGALQEKLEDLAELCVVGVGASEAEVLAEVRRGVAEALEVSARRTVDQNALAARVAELEDQVSALSEDVEGLRSERDAYLSAVEQLETELREAAHSSREEEAQEVDGLRATVEALSSELGTTREALEDAWEALGATRKDLEASGLNLEALREEVELARASQEEAWSAADGAKADAEVWREEREALEASLAEATTARDKAEAALKGALEGMEGAQAELQQALVARAAAEEQVAEVDTDAELARAETRELQEELKRQRSMSARRLGQLQAQVKGLRGKLQQATSSAGQVEEFQRTLEDVRGLAEDVKALEEENQRLSRLVGEARQRGRVDLDDILRRASLVRRLERLANDLERTTQ